MKKTIAISCLLTLIAFSCTKSDVTKPTSINSTSNVSASTTARNNFSQLTAHTWIYTKYYTSSTDSLKIGELAYKRGRLNNSIILDNNTVKFNEDGTVDEYTNDGTYVPGTWSFTNNAQTSMVVSNSYGTFYSNILKLSDDKFIWNNPYDETTGIMETK